MTVGRAALLAACGGNRTKAEYSSLERMNLRGAVQEVVTYTRQADAETLDVNNAPAAEDRSGRMLFDKEGNMASSEQFEQNVRIAWTECRYDGSHRLKSMTEQYGFGEANYRTYEWHNATDYRCEIRNATGDLLFEETFVREGDRSVRRRVSSKGAESTFTTTYSAGDRIDRQESVTSAGTVVIEYRYGDEGGDPIEQQVFTDGEPVAHLFMTYETFDGEGNWTRCVIASENEAGQQMPVSVMDRAITYYR